MQKQRNTVEHECLKETERVEIYFDLESVDPVVLDLKDTEAMYKLMGDAQPIVLDELDQLGLDVLPPGDEEEFEFEFEFDPELLGDIDPEDIRDDVIEQLKKVQEIYVQYHEEQKYVTVIISGHADVVTKEHVLAIVGVITRALGLVVPTFITRTRFVMQPSVTEELERSEIIQAKKQLKGDNV